MNEPDMKSLARASEASYSQDKEPPNYERQHDLSTADISVYKHKKDPHHIIAHRGTDAHSDTISKQLKADLNIAVGNKNGDKLHKDRTKQTEDIVKKIKDTNPNHTIHLTGHSLGSSTAQHSMVKSKIVRDNVNSVDTFNAGSSIIGGKGLSTKSKAYKDIASKSTHHTISGDLISENADKAMIGRVIKYENKQKPTIAQHILKMATPILRKSLLGRGISMLGGSVLGTMSSHSMKNFTK
jgi:hypothetical protein